MLWAVGKCSPKATAFLLLFSPAYLKGVSVSPAPCICAADREQKGVTHPFSPCVPQRNRSAWLTDAPVDSTRATLQEPTLSTSKSSPHPTAHFRLCKFLTLFSWVQISGVKKKSHSAGSYFGGCNLVCLMPCFPTHLFTPCVRYSWPLLSHTQRCPARCFPAVFYLCDLLVTMWSHVLFPHAYVSRNIREAVHCLGCGPSHFREKALQWY